MNGILEAKIALSDAANQGKITREQEYTGMVALDRLRDAQRAPMSFTGLLVLPWCLLCGQIK